MKHEYYRKNAERNDLIDFSLQNDLFVALAEQGFDREFIFAAAHDVGRSFFVDKQHDRVYEN